MHTNTHTHTPNYGDHTSALHLVPLRARSPAYEAGQGRAEKAALQLAIKQAQELQATADRIRNAQAHDRQLIEQRGFEAGERKGYVDGQNLGLMQGLVCGLMLSGVAALVFRWFTAAA